MKKVALFLAFLMIVAVGFGQANKSVLVTVQAVTDKIGTGLRAGDRVYCVANTTEYILTTSQGYTATVTTILASGNYTQLVTSSSTPTFVSVNTGQGANELYDMDQNVLTTSDVTFDSLTLTDDLVLAAAKTFKLGAQTLVQTNTNKATFNNSLAVTDTAFAGVLNVTGTITGSSVTRGTASFSTTLTRVAIYLAGVTSTNSYVYVQATAPTDAFTRPVAGDFMNVKLINDSIIVMRQAGTTSGLTFDWFRIK